MAVRSLGAGRAMEELDQFAGGTILHHTLSGDVYEMLSDAVED